MTVRGSESPPGVSANGGGSVVIGNLPPAELLFGVFVAAVLVITFRRKTHMAIEIAAWIGLVWACLVVLTGNRDPQIHALTTSAVWGTSRVVSTIAGAFKLDALRWTYGARFLIAGWVVLLFGVDVLALALVSTKRQAGARMPATKLRKWWVLPSLPGTRPVRLAAPSAVDEINQRFNTWMARAALAAAMWSTLLLIWLRDVEIPDAARSLGKLAFPAVDLLRRAVGSRRVTKSGAVGRGIVLSNSRAATSGARSAKTLTARGTSITRTASADARTETSGSKKHRQSRLAS